MHFTHNSTDTTSLPSKFNWSECNVKLFWPSSCHTATSLAEAKFNFILHLKSSGIFYNKPSTCLLEGRTTQRKKKQTNLLLLFCIWNLNLNFRIKWVVGWSGQKTLLFWRMCQYSNVPWEQKFVRNAEREPLISHTPNNKSSTISPRFFR